MLQRDWLGEKPLYWSKINNRVVQSENISDLVTAETKADPYGMAKFLYHQYVPGKFTVYGDIYKEKPGILNALPSEKIIDTPVEARLMALMLKVVDEMIGEEKEDIGVFLSGGLDSSIIGMLVDTVAKGKVHTFSVIFPTFSEGKYARQVSDYLGTEHHEILITPQMALEVLPELVKAYGEPIGDAATICNYIMAREAKKYVDRAFSGDGGDEIFAGYPWHRLIVQMEKLFTMPGAVKKLIGLGIKAVPGRGKPHGIMGLLHSRAGVFCQKDIWATQAYMEKALSVDEIEYLTRLPLDDPMKGMRIPVYLKHTLNRAQMFDILNILPEKFCMKAYGSTKLAGLTELAPFQAREVVEFAFSIPRDKKLAGAQGKWILRHSFDEMLPKNILMREKQGFGTPVGAWLRDWEFFKEISSKLHGSQFAEEYIKTDDMLDLLRHIKDEEVRNYHEANVIWTLYALASWYQAHVA